MRGKNSVSVENGKGELTFAFAGCKTSLTTQQVNKKQYVNVHSVKKRYNPDVFKDYEKKEVVKNEKETLCRTYYGFYGRHSAGRLR